MKKNARIIMSVMGLSLCSVSAYAEPLYLLYKMQDTGEGGVAVVYPTIDECQKTTEQTCIMSELICGGYEFATVELGFERMKNNARAESGEVLFSVGKDVAEMNATYNAAEESDFKIKLCVPKTPSALSGEGE